MGEDKVNHKNERDSDVSKIVDSDHPRKVVVAGPGTGKTYLFEQQIRKMCADGKRKILALTFVGKLEAFLADDLAGLAETRTLHSFARWFVLKHCPKGWRYYPKIKNIIMDDFKVVGVDFEGIADENYKTRTKYYKAIGEDDVVYYAAQICKKDPSKIPIYDLILIDEFQDFNETESELIDILALKNDILIVGDDDQALYGFKKSSPEYIRTKFSQENEEYESHTLRYCSRCTPVIIAAFHDLVGNSNLYDKDTSRINKIFTCYLPDKKIDNRLNPHLMLIKDAPPNSLDIMIKKELEEILEEQKIKSVLIIGEPKSCQTILKNIGKKLIRQGFRNVKSSYEATGMVTFKEHVLEAYKSVEINPVLAWRLLSIELGEDEYHKYIVDSFDNKDGIKESLPDEFVKVHSKAAKTFNKISTKSESGINGIADSSIKKLHENIVKGAKTEREIFIKEINKRTRFLPNPLANLDITVCNILGAKGLGADVVFLVGFDQGKLPAKVTPKLSEIYQMLVALTRAKKRIYLINTVDKEISQFINLIDSKHYRET